MRNFRENAEDFFKVLESLQGDDWRLQLNSNEGKITLHLGEKGGAPGTYESPNFLDMPKESIEWFLSRVDEITKRKQSGAKSAAVHHTVAPYEFLKAIRRAPDRNWKVVFNDFEQIVFLYNGVGSDKLACPVTYECPYHDMDPGKVAQFVDQVSQTILWKIGGAQAMAEPRDVRSIKTPVSTTRLDGMGLTRAEHDALSKLGEVAQLFALEIIGLGVASERDSNEAAAKIHDLQRMIMAQAAARAHPDLYRLLGRHGDWLSAK